MDTRLTANMTNTLQEEKKSFAYSFLPGALFVGLLWLVSLLTYLTETDLVWLGVQPRNFFGLIGVVTGPLIHSGLMHLLSNSFPLILLSGFILFQHRRVAGNVFLLVYVLSGILTWFIGRPAYHIGASGVVYGLAGFLLFNGLIQRDRAGLAISLAILFLYGGLFYGLFPNEERISWEGHLGGILSGLVAAIVYGKEKTATKSGTDAAYKADYQGIHPHMNTTLGASQGYFNYTYTVSPAPEGNKVKYMYYLREEKGITEAPKT